MQPVLRPAPAPLMKQTPLHAPHLPFESIEDDGLPSGPRLLRPLVQAFEHNVLPEALRINHPELLRALQPVPTAGMDFLQLWFKSLVLCEDSRLWPAARGDDPAFAAYLRPLAEAVHCQPTRNDEHMVWTLRTPTPKAAGETHFIALCRRHDDTTPFGQPSATAHCFTLEAGRLAGEAFLCEWTPGGRHVQHGVATTLAEEAFTAWVCQRLAAPPRGQPRHPPG